MSFTVRIKTLTPLWTGGLDGTMDRLHETGILGSLRWWYEAIVRGLGGSACDPSKHTCSFDADKYRKSTVSNERQRLRDAGLCDACQVFGATGWRRRVQVVIIEDKTYLAWEPRDRSLNICPPERGRGWYLFPGYVGTLTLKFEGEGQVISLLASLFLWLEKYGSLGARSQLGYGAFCIVNRDEISEKANRWKWVVLREKVQNANSDQDNLYYPDLRRFLFFRYEFTPSKPGWWAMVPGVGRVGSRVQPLVSKWGMVPTTPALKNHWRFHKWRGGKHRPHDEDIREIFGALRPDRRRGRISATWAYKKDGIWAIHGWAWMPQNDEWAKMLWQMLTDQSVWEEVIGVPDTLMVDPSGQWRERTPEDVQKLLQGLCHD